MKVTVQLTTTGQRSGTPRPVTLYAYEDAGRLVVVGSRGGAATDPSWAHNLRADPRASVRRGRPEPALRSREVEGEERERLWALATDEFPLYVTYQRKTTRRIPVFLLEPVTEEG